MVRLRSWLLGGTTEHPSSHLGPYRKPTEDEHTYPWWKVMCLTGVDYFSTLGYQPGIAALAAGTLAPLATVVLVLLTLFGALPVYRRVCRESPTGEGSIAMLEKLLPRWRGKLLVLALLGFAATDFLITMTLSAADASAHIIENPYAPDGMGSTQVVVTLVLLAMLAAVFLRGFTQAIGIAVALVVSFLAVNLVVVIAGSWEIAQKPSLLFDWQHAMTAQHGNPLMMIAFALIVFPKLALGLSGFETGVAVMPQIDGGNDDQLGNRISDARRLITTAALVMCSFLLTSSIITTVLIPQEEFQPGGQANGRALSYLAHEQLGEVFGTVYDVSTITILWFAGASAMAGLLNLVPLYLPKYGMAPEWARAARPMVLVFALIAAFVTLYFDASVDAQGAAYATGVLVLITSAAVAVTISSRRDGRRRQAWLFGLVAIVFVYTTATNIVERPDGVKVASFFVVAILVVSFWSRVARSFELRATSVTFDEEASKFLSEAASGHAIQLVSHDSRHLELSRYEAKERQQRAHSHIPAEDHVLFLEVNIENASDFSTDLVVHGRQKGDYRILWLDAAAVPNSIAAVLLEIRDVTGFEPNVYFEWSEGNPIVNLARFLFIGVGEVAAVTREVLRRAEPDRAQRPNVHVG
ncbi:MAG: amino acid transporter [Rhodococcus sp. (in: high G+C Gram-positive bacteria)]